MASCERLAAQGIVVSSCECADHICLCMHCVPLCPAHPRGLCLRDCAKLESHVHGIMCREIWLRRNSPAAVISVFLVGIMLKTKNDWNDSDLPAWLTVLPQHENISRSSTVRDLMVSLCCDFVRACWGGSRGKRPRTEPGAIQLVDFPPGEIRT